MSKIIEFARKQVGKPYVFGKSGPDSFDCSGLTKAAGRQINLDLYHGATTQWLRGKQSGAAHQYGYFDETGPIKDLPMDKMAFLFNQDTKRTDRLVMAHTGLYDGNGRVVQAGGYGGRGVHYNPLIKSKWSHYALLTPYWADRDGDTQMDTTLRRGSIGDAVKALQVALIALGYDVGAKTQADGKYGPATENGVKKFQGEHGLPITGVWGKAEWDRLHEIQNAPPVDIPAPEPPKPEVDRAAMLEDLSNYLDRAQKIIKVLKETVV